MVLRLLAFQTKAQAAEPRAPEESRHFPANH
jgi:hypothetical protein